MYAYGKHNRIYRIARLTCDWSAVILWGCMLMIGHGLHELANERLNKYPHILDQSR